jgi:hypothetical protein
MAASDVSSAPHVIVVGDRSGHFVREMVNLAGRCELGLRQCDDVYAAAAELARGGGRRLAVTGLFRELTRAKYAFLALLERRGIPCCCLLDGDAGAERERLVAAVRRGVRLAAGMDEVREFLETWLAAAAARPPETGEDVFREDYRATEAEIEALLGHEKDE